jgi:hypothetical protein
MSNPKPPIPASPFIKVGQSNDLLCLQFGGPSQLVVGNGEAAKAVLAGRGDAGLTFSANSANPKVSEWHALARRYQ